MVYKHYWLVCRGAPIHKVQYDRIQDQVGSDLE